MSGDGGTTSSPRDLVGDFLALSSSSSSSSSSEEIARAANRIACSLEEEEAAWDGGEDGESPLLGELIPRLVECCSPLEEAGGEEGGGDRGDRELVAAASFRCLLAALRFRRRRGGGASAPGGAGGNGDGSMIDGSSLPALAGAMVAALSLPSSSTTNGGGETPSSSSSLRATVLDVIGELVHRPRGGKGRAELNPASLRDLILLPLLLLGGGERSGSGAHEAASELFARAVVSSAELASSGGSSPHNAAGGSVNSGNSDERDDDDDDELEALQRQIRGETAALGTIQALGSDVFDRILSALPVLCRLDDGGTEDGEEGVEFADDLRADVERANASLEAVVMVYGVATDAVRGRVQERFGSGTGVEGDGSVTTLLEERFVLLDREGEEERRRGRGHRLSSNSGKKSLHHNDRNGSVQSTPARGGDRPGAGSRIPETPAPVPATPGPGGDVVVPPEDDQPDMPPFLSGVSDPLRIPSKSQLASVLSSISEALEKTDSDSWDVRMDALARIERLAAGGTLRLHHHHPPAVFVTALRTMPMQAQIEDLRSQVTVGACRAVAAVAYELRGGDHFSPLAEMWMPSVLKLSTSGVRLMAVQGERCVVQLTAFAGPGGYPRLIPTFCDGCLTKTHHQNYKKCCVIALAVALRVWSDNANSALERHVAKIEKAILTAAENRDPTVREEGRKSFWALHARFPAVADAAMGNMDVTSKKRLMKCKDAADAEWDVGGPMHAAAVLGRDVHSAPASAGIAGGGGGGKTGKSRASAAPSRRGVGVVAPPGGSTRKPRVARAGGANAAKVASTTVVPSGGGVVGVAKRNGVRRPGSAPGGGGRRGVLPPPPPATPARGSSLGAAVAPASASRTVGGAAGRVAAAPSSVVAATPRSTRKPWRRASSAAAGGGGGRGDVSVVVAAAAPPSSRRPASERKLGRPASLTSAAAAASERKLGRPASLTSAAAASAAAAGGTSSSTEAVPTERPTRSHPGAAGRIGAARRIGTAGGGVRPGGAGAGRIRRPATAPPSSSTVEGDNGTGTRREVRAVDSSGRSDSDRLDTGGSPKRDRSAHITSGKSKDDEGADDQPTDVDVTGDGIDGKRVDPPVAASSRPPTKGPLTLTTFLSSIDSDDWSARERGLSHLASSLSMCDDDGDDGTATTVDASTFAADASSRRSFASALAGSIGDDNLPVAMAALEACHYSLMNATLAPVITGHLQEEGLLLRPILDRGRGHPDPADPVNCLVRDCLDAAGYVAPPPPTDHPSSTTAPIREEGEGVGETVTGVSPHPSSTPLPLVASTATASPSGQDVVPSTTLTTSDGESVPPPPSHDEISPKLESKSHDSGDEAGATPTTTRDGNPELYQSTQGQGATTQSLNELNANDPNNHQGGKNPSPSMPDGESSIAQESSEGETSNAECRDRAGSGTAGIHDRDDEKATVPDAELTLESVSSPAEQAEGAGIPDLREHDPPRDEKAPPVMRDDERITLEIVSSETSDASNEQLDGKETGTSEFNDQDTEKEPAATTSDVEHAPERAVDGDPSTVEQADEAGSTGTEEDLRENDDHFDEEFLPTMPDADSSTPQPPARHETPAEQSNEPDADVAAPSQEQQEEANLPATPDGEGSVQQPEAQGDTPFEAVIESKSTPKDHQLTQGEESVEVVMESKASSHDHCGREEASPTILDSVPSLEPPEQGETPLCQVDEKPSPTEQNSKVSMELSVPNEASCEDVVTSEQPSHHDEDAAEETPGVAQHSQQSTQSEASYDEAETTVPIRDDEWEDGPPSIPDVNGRNHEQSGLKVESSSPEAVSKAEAPSHDATEQLSPPTPGTNRSAPEHSAQGETPADATSTAQTPSQRHYDEENRNIAPSSDKGTKEVSFAHVEASSMRTPLAKINNGKVDYSSQKKQLTPGFPRTPLTDPVLRYMTRPSPLTAVKLSKNRMDDMPKLIDKLSGDYPTQELYPSMQTLLKLARDKRQPEVWDRYFGDVVRCLLDGIERRPTRATNLLSDFNDDNQVPSSPPMSVEDDSSESRHIYLQGLRVLIKYQPSHFEKVTGSVIEPLLRCSQDSNYFVVHTAERALENIVSKQDPIRCFDALLPNLAALADDGDDDSLPVLLSMLRALAKLIRRLPGQVLRDALPTLMACIVRSIAHPSVDLRKASVLAMVELHYTLGVDFSPHLDGLNDVQRRLVSFYIDRREASTKE